MRASLRAWYASEFPIYDGRGSRSTFGAEKLRRFDLATRQSPIADGLIQHGPERHFQTLSESQILQLLDWWIANTNLRAYPGKGEEVERILRDGGSRWRVGMRNGVPGLEERVSQGVQDAADAVMSSSQSAGAILSEAWHAAFGRSPDAEEAYEKAIKAVEEAGAHIVTPNNKKATLGTMVRDMKAQKDWRLELPSPDADVPVTMAEALWIGQESRHGGNGYRKPTQAEAEAAVLLAVSLVHWFASGALARRP